MQEIIDAFRTKLGRMAEEYKTQAELAKKLGVTPSTISRWLGKKIDIRNLSVATYLEVMGSLPDTPETKYEGHIDRDLAEKLSAVREIMESADQMVIEALTKNLNVFQRDAREWKKLNARRKREHAA